MKKVKCGHPTREGFFDRLRAKWKEEDERNSKPQLWLIELSNDGWTIEKSAEYHGSIDEAEEFGNTIANGLGFKKYVIRNYARESCYTTRY